MGVFQKISSKRKRYNVESRSHTHTHFFLLFKIKWGLGVASCGLVLPLFNGYWLWNISHILSPILAQQGKDKNYLPTLHLALKIWNIFYRKISEREKEFNGGGKCAFWQIIWNFPFKFKTDLPGAVSLSSRRHFSNRNLPTFQIPTHQKSSHNLDHK